MPSFDFAYWQNDDTELITSFLANYSDHPGQAKYNGGQIASTFVGDSFDWGPVKSALGSKLTALPNLQDPIESVNNTKSIDGALSWLAWPTDGGNSIIPGPMTTTWDDRYVQDLGDLIYLAPVSPWFSTHFNSKNWVFICEQLITDRWEEMLALKPTLIEIITCASACKNRACCSAIAFADGTTTARATTLRVPSPTTVTTAHPSGRRASLTMGKGLRSLFPFPRTYMYRSWRHIMKPYIAAYKAGADKPTVEEDELVYWCAPHWRSSARRVLTYSGTSGTGPRPRTSNAPTTHCPHLRASTCSRTSSSSPPYSPRPAP